MNPAVTVMMARVSARLATPRLSVTEAVAHEKTNAASGKTMTDRGVNLLMKEFLVSTSTSVVHNFRDAKNLDGFLARRVVRCCLDYGVIKTRPKAWRLSM